MLIENLVILGKCNFSVPVVYFGTEYVGYANGELDNGFVKIKKIEWLNGERNLAECELDFSCFVEERIWRVK